LKVSLKAQALGIREKYVPSTLRVEIQISRATMEISMEVPQKAKTTSAATLVLHLSQACIQKGQSQHAINTPAHPASVAALFTIASLPINR
jgi:hypothetical protein